MAILHLGNGNVETDLAAIAQRLKPLGVKLQHRDLNPIPLVSLLLERDVLNADHKQQLMELYKHEFARLGRPDGYTWCDFLLIHPGSPNLQSLISNYSRYHIHTAPEAVYALMGEAIFGFVQPTGEQLQLLVQPGDFLQIDTEVEHWFSPAASLHFKAARYFSTPAGSMPYYTETPVNDSSRSPSE